jgi:uncharacterized protein (TIGR02588 family)
VAITGALFVLLAIGYMAWGGLRRPSDPIPRVSIQVDTVQQVDALWLVRFTVANRGTQTASGLTVEGRLRDGDSTVESSSVTLDYVPSHSVRRGGLFFRRDPRPLRVEIVPRGYELP